MAADAESEKDPAAGTAAGEANDASAADRRTGPRQRPPVTIDLTAAEVRAAAVPAEPAAAQSGGAEDATDAKPAGEQRRATDGPGTAQYFRSAAKAFSTDAGFRRNLLVGAVGGLVALVVVLLLQSVGILPAPGRSAANQAIQQAKAAADATAALDRRLTAVETMTEAISGLRGDIKALSDRLTSLEAIRGMIASREDIDTLAGSFAALGKRIDSLPPAVSRDDLAAVADRLARLEAAVATGGNGQGASSAAVASLTGQLGDAQAQIRSLGDRVAAAEARAASAGPASGGADAIRAMAMVSLRRAAESGQPFAADVDMVANLGAGGGDIAIVRPLAARGVEARAALASEFPSIADAILAAATRADPNAGFLQRMLGGLGGLITIRPMGPLAGGDPPAIVSRMRDDVGKGDLAAALAERDGLPPAARDASADWAAKAADRVALDAAVERIAAALGAAKAG